MNREGLKDVKELVDSLQIECWITGINCDGSWYLTIRKMNELKDFYKKPSRKLHLLVYQITSSRAC